MVDLAPFRGLRYADGIPLRDVTAPPYDAIDDRLRERLHRRHPHNVVRLERGLGDADRYRRSATTYRRWLEEGVLVPDARPCLYVYEESFLDGDRPRRQRGVIAAVAVEDWDRASVLPHEDTFQPAIDDRLRLLEAVPANTSPIFLLGSEEPPEVGRALDRTMTTPPVASFSDRDGVEHRLWVAADDETHRAVTEAYADVVLLVADGHHRYTTSLQYHQRAPSAPGSDRIMAYVVGGAGPVVAATHRLILDGGPAVDALLSRSTRVEDVVPADGARAGADTYGALLRADDATFGLIVRDDGGARGRLVSLGADAAAGPAEVDAVRVDRLLEDVLAPDASLAYEPDADRAARAVSEGRAVAAVLVRPVSVEQVRRIAHAGRRLPPKTTSFQPKPRTGLVLRPLAALA